LAANWRRRISGGNEVAVEDRIAAGSRLLEALAAHDYAGIEAILHPNVRFRGLTPREIRHVFGATATIAIMRRWFGEQGGIALLDARVSTIGDRLSLRYRYVRGGAGARLLTEQQAYARVEGGRIVDLAILCSGPQPVAASEGVTAIP
jgi:hypothetical protein